MLLFVAHPDDEVIFFAPLLNSKLPNFPGENEIYGEIDKVVCMTCKDDPIRSTEFKRLADCVGFQGEIFNIPIVRGFSLENYYQILKQVQSCVSLGAEKCVTHSLYGDDHFHPQHVLLSIAVTYVCIRQGLRIVVAECDCSTIQLFLRAFKRTDWRRLKSIAFLPLKLALIIIHKILFKPEGLYQADQDILDNARFTYTSQSLEYPSFIENSYRFALLRNIWTSKSTLGDKL